MSGRRQKSGKNRDSAACAAQSRKAWLLLLKSDVANGVRDRMRRCSAKAVDRSERAPWVRERKAEAETVKLEAVQFRSGRSFCPILCQGLGRALRYDLHDGLEKDSKD